MDDKLKHKGSRCRHFRVVALLVLGLFALSCYGRFSLTRTVYQWNGEIEDRYLRSAVMVILFALPAYPVVVLSDVLVFNVVEFWTGQNPVSEPDVEQMDSSNESSSSHSGARITAGKEPQEVIVTPGPDGKTSDPIGVQGSGSGILLKRGDSGFVEAHPPDGGVPIIAKPGPDGGILLFTKEGIQVGYFSAEEVDNLFRNNQAETKPLH